MKTSNLPESPARESQARPPEVKLALIGGRSCGKTTLLGCLVHSELVTLADGARLHVNLFDPGSQQALWPVYERLTRGDNTAASALVSYPDILFRLEKFDKSVAEGTDPAGPAASGETILDEWNVVTRDYAGRLMELAEASVESDEIGESFRKEIDAVLRECDAAMFLLPVDLDSEDRKDHALKYYKHLDTVIEAIRTNGAEGRGRKPVVIGLTKWDLVAVPGADPDRDLESFLARAGDMRARVESLCLLFPKTQVFPVSAYGRHDPGDPAKPLKGQLRPKNVAPMLEAVCRNVTDRRKDTLRRELDGVSQADAREKIGLIRERLPGLAAADRGEFKAELGRLEPIATRKRKMRRRLFAAAGLAVILAGAFFTVKGIVRLNKPRVDELSNYLASAQDNDVSMPDGQYATASAFANSLRFSIPYWLGAPGYAELRTRWSEHERERGMAAENLLEQLERENETLWRYVDNDNLLIADRLERAKDLDKNYMKMEQLLTQLRKPDSMDPRQGRLTDMIKNLNKWRDFENDYDNFKLNLRENKNQAEAVVSINEFMEKFGGEEYKYSRRNQIFQELLSEKIKLEHNDVVQIIYDNRELADKEYGKDPAGESAMKAYKDHIKMSTEAAKNDAELATRLQPDQTRSQKRLDKIKDKRDTAEYDKVKRAFGDNMGKDWLGNFHGALVDYGNFENDGQKAHSNIVQEWLEFTENLQNPTQIVISVRRVNIEDAVKALSGKGWGSWWYFKLTMFQKGIGEFAAFGPKNGNVDVPGKFETGQEVKWLDGNYFRIYPLDFKFTNGHWSQSAAIRLDKEITVCLSQAEIGNAYNKPGPSPTTTAWLPYLAAKSKNGEAQHPFTFVFTKDNEPHRAVVILSFSGLPKTPKALP